MDAREKLHRLRRKSRPLKRAAVNRERYLEKLSEAYFSHLGFKIWEREEGRTPMRAGAMEPLDHWFGMFSKNIGSFGSRRAPEAGELARDGLTAEQLRKKHRQHIRKFAGAAMLAFGLLAGATMTANALSRNPWRQQIMGESDDQINIFSEQEDAYQTGFTRREGYYELDYIPRGYIQKESHICGNSISKTYKKGNKLLVFESNLRDLNVYAMGFMVDSLRYHWGEAEVTCLSEKSNPENGIAICYMNEGIVTFEYIGMEQTELKKIIENLKFSEME